MPIRSVTFQSDEDNVSARRIAADWWASHKRTLGEMLFMATLLVFVGSMMTLRVLVTTPGLSLN